MCCHILQVRNHIAKWMLLDSLIEALKAEAHKDISHHKRIFQHALISVREYVKALMMMSCMCCCCLEETRDYEDV